MLDCGRVLKKKKVREKEDEESREEDGRQRKWGTAEAVSRTVMKGDSP